MSKGRAKKVSKHSGKNDVVNNQPTNTIETIAQAPLSEEQIAALEAMRDQLMAEIEQSQQDFEKQQQEIATKKEDMQQQLQPLKDELAELQGQRDNIENELADIRAKAEQEKEDMTREARQKLEDAEKEKKSIEKEKNDVLTAAEKECAAKIREAQKNADNITQTAKNEVKAKQIEINQYVVDKKAEGDQYVLDKKAELSGRESEVTIREKEVSDREKAVYKETQELIKEKEEAKNGFPKAFEEFKIAFDQEQERVKQEIEASKVERKKIIAALEKEAQDKEAQNVARTIQLEKEMSVHRDRLMKEVNDDIALEKQKWEEEKERLDQYKYQLMQRETDLNNEKDLLKENQEQLKLDQEILVYNKNMLQQTVNQKVEDEYQDLLDQKDRLAKKLDDALNEVSKCKQEISKRNSIIKSSQIEEKTELIQQNKQLQEDLDRQKEQIEKLQNELVDLGIAEKDKADAKAKIKQYDKMAKAYDDLKNKNAELEQDIRRMNDNGRELDYQKNRNACLLSAMEMLEEELAKRTEVSRDKRISSVVKCEGFEPSKRPQFPRELEDENKWLEYIQSQAANSGIVFSKRLLKAYHTSVKIGQWSPLVVLAGVSGTGKSEMPRQYALHGGMKFLSVPVKPDWDSPQSLFGYYNSIENRFEATELLRALYQMQEGKNCGDEMLIVLLDEMNLAHVELYFSDLLSKFETRRGSNDFVNYEISLGAGVDSEQLKIGTNVLWTGTMNDDETTNNLSDKVIDRSTLITFPRPKKLIGRTQTTNQSQKYVLKKGSWNRWIKDSSEILNYSKEIQDQLDKLKGVVEDINNVMSQLNRNLGHRVWQSIQNYIVNHPDVIASINNNKDTKEAIQEAFTEAVAFKIMPKLRGVETSGEYEDILQGIADIIAKDIPALSQDFSNARSLPSKLFVWHSAEFLEDKTENK